MNNLQAVVDHRWNNTTAHPASYKSANGNQYEDGRVGVLQVGYHALFCLLPGQTVEDVGNSKGNYSYKKQCELGRAGCHLVPKYPDTRKNNNNKKK